VEEEEESGRYGREREEEEEEEGQKRCSCRLEKALMWQVNRSELLFPAPALVVQTPPAQAPAQAHYQAHPLTTLPILLSLLQLLLPTTVLITSTSYKPVASPSLVIALPFPHQSQRRL
jgi:hypothetical protein